MTINASNSDPKTTYDGDDSTTAFPTVFRFIQTSHLLVTLRDANGAETVQVLNTDYTVTGENEANGGTVTMTTAPANGEKLVIELNVPGTQLKSFPLGGPFPSTEAEEAVDLLTQLFNQLKALFDRVLRLPTSDDPTSDVLLLPTSAERRGKFFAFEDTDAAKAIAAAGTSANLGPVSAYIDTLLDDADAATARDTLEAVGRAGDETIAGAKTFSGKVNLDGPLALGGGSELTIASGAITPTANYHLVDTQANDATDDLTTVATTNVEDGAILVLQPANDARTVVIKHAAAPAAGEIVTADGKDIALDDIEDMILLKRRGIFWEEVARNSPQCPPGALVQARVASTTTEFTITTVIPFDATTPQNTEGDEVLTVSITPKYANSKLRLTFSASIGGSGAIATCIALFQDSVADALHASYIVPVGANSNSNPTPQWIVDATDTDARTYKVRVGPGSGTAYVNRSSSTPNLYGAGKMQATLTVEEIAQ